MLTSRYSYDHAGLRRSKRAGAAETKYVWADGELLSELTPYGQVDYERAGELVVAAGGGRLLRDGLSSVVGRHSGGNVTLSRYDAWGNPTSPLDPAGPSLAYAGQHFDADVGLSYAQQRWYDPATGRFLSEDPVFGDLADPMSLHAFAYENGNPTRFVDPEGELAFLAPLVPILGKALWAGLIAAEGHIIYQELAENRLSFEEIQFGRAATFGGAAAATVMSGGTFGEGATAIGFAIGGGYDIAGQIVLEKRTFGEVDFESTFSKAGYGSVLGSALGAGARSAKLGVKAATGVAGFVLGFMGAVEGREHMREGYASGDTAKIWFGAAEAGLGLLGAASSARLAQKSLFDKFGLEFVEVGLGSNFGNVRIRRRSAGKPAATSVGDGDGVSRSDNAPYDAFFFRDLFS